MLLRARLPQVRRLCFANGTLSEPSSFVLHQSIHLETLILDNQEIESGLELDLPPILKHLEITRCRIKGRSLLRSIPNQWPHAFLSKTLKTFSTLYTVPRLDELRILIQTAVSLIAPGALLSLGLSLGEAQWQDIAPLMHFGWLRELESLQLDGTELKDRDSQWLIANCPNLKELHLIHAVNLTGVFLLDMIKAPTCVLRKVSLTTCHKVSKDIVPWARERGVEIRYMAAANASEMNGRKVREYY